MVAPPVGYTVKGRIKSSAPRPYGTMTSSIGAVIIGSSVFGGGECQVLGGVSHGVGGKEMVPGFGGALFAGAGVGISF